MKFFTVDASVIIKWIFPEAREDHLPQALSLLKGIKIGEINVLQPPHWLAEVVAVIARLQPKIVEESISLLNAMEFQVIDAPEIYHIACQLSEKFNHHLFDTLYHAVAIYNGNAKFITADDQYYKKTFKKGNIVRLADFSIFDD